MNKQYTTAVLIGSNKRIISKTLPVLQPVNPCVANVLFWGPLFEGEHKQIDSLRR